MHSVILSTDCEVAISVSDQIAPEHTVNSLTLAEIKFEVSKEN